MPQRYVIMGTGADSMVLGLEARTDEDARRAIRWQHTGGFEGPFHICDYDADGKNFVSIETGERFAPGIGPFTIDAWRRFRARLDPDLGPEDGFRMPESGPSP